MRSNNLRKFGSFFAIFAMIFVTSSPVSASATLENQPDKSVRHKESGWLFPKRVGSMDSLKDAKAIIGTEDVVAGYENGKGENRIIGDVYVYPRTSPALDASYAGANTAIVSLIRGPLSMNQLWSEGPFIVGTDRKLMGRKAFYKLGLGPTSVSTNLYFFDLGKWVVKVRVSGKENADAQKIANAFVKALPWESLKLAEFGCTGFSCTVTTPEPIHGLVPEIISMLMVDKAGFQAEKVDTICDPGALVASYAAAPKQGANGLAQPIEKVASCRVGKVSIGFIRFVLPPEMLSKLEDSPDGLSLRGPFSFVMAKDGDVTHMAELYDGTLDAAAITAMLSRVKDGKQIDFATQAGKDKVQPIIRFIN
jgi:hypothetical protein